MNVDALEASPPRRPRALLQRWVTEFIAEGHLVAGAVRVVEQEDTDNQDTGLVVLHLAGKNVTIHMQPVGFDEPIWEQRSPRDPTSKPSDRKNSLASPPSSSSPATSAPTYSGDPSNGTDRAVGAEISPPA